MFKLPATVSMPQYTSQTAPIGSWYSVALAPGHIGAAVEMAVLLEVEDDAVELVEEPKDEDELALTLDEELAFELEDEDELELAIELEDEDELELAIELEDEEPDVVTAGLEVVALEVEA